jgi:hypothetical protein
LLLISVLFLQETDYNLSQLVFSFTKLII